MARDPLDGFYELQFVLEMEWGYVKILDKLRRFFEFFKNLSFFEFFQPQGLRILLYGLLIRYCLIFGRNEMVFNSLSRVLAIPGNFLSCNTILGNISVKFAIVFFKFAIV